MSTLHQKLIRLAHENPYLRSDLMPLIKSAGRVVAYHYGNGKFNQFDVNKVGMGEGLSALGPGIYFATDRTVAERYAKYSADPHLYTVTINTSGIYENRTGQPAPLREKLIALRDKLVSEGKLTVDRSGWPRGVNNLQHGPGSIGAVFKALGPRAGRAALAKIGITGLKENITHGVEFALYDMSAVKITSVEKMQPDALRVASRWLLARNPQPV